MMNVKIWIAERGFFFSLSFLCHCRPACDDHTTNPTPVALNTTITPANDASLSSIIVTPIIPSDASPYFTDDGDQFLEALLSQETRSLCDIGAGREVDECPRNFFPMMDPKTKEHVAMVPALVESVYITVKSSCELATLTYVPMCFCTHSHNLIPSH
jgi:hypothetical protein